MSGKPLLLTIAALLFVLLHFTLYPVMAQVALPVADLSPKDGETVIGRRPAVRIVMGEKVPPFVAGQVLVAIDGVDVTPQVQLKDRSVTYRPVSDLEPGSHSVMLTVTDPSGQPVAEQSQVTQ